MNQNLSPSNSGVYIRGTLYVLIAVIGFILSSETWQRLLGAPAIAVLGAVSAGLLAWRVYIDTSVAQNKAGQVPDKPIKAEITNNKNNPVPTTEEPAP